MFYIEFGVSDNRAVCADPVQDASATLFMYDDGDELMHTWWKELPD